MQQEDDLRGLGQTMQFMRGISLLFVLVHLYWYCHDWFAQQG
ncbi:conjugal transfer protein TraG [Alistipes inops]|uniref:Conjugal transfer protein TraG n=1 Tax=Alistipes inops TaxID=1501391 RepID=A0ABR4YKV2_9BACT|nr:conjugal transfer protein TraG [Alistipes inops]